MRPSLMTWLFSHVPALADWWARSRKNVRYEDVPWATLELPLARARIALVTTAGVHLRSQSPFDMKDPMGDPSYREIPAGLGDGDWTITHDYYDHRDADADLDVVLPLRRLRELAEAGEVGEVAPRHFSFMGHIDGPHVKTLIERTAPEVAARLLEDEVRAVVLSPA